MARFDVRCGAAIGPQLGAERKSLALARNDVNDPKRQFAARLRCNAAFSIKLIFAEGEEQSWSPGDRLQNVRYTR